MKSVPMHFITILLSLALAVTQVNVVAAKHWDLKVNLSRSTGEFSHFWKSTGFWQYINCPAASQEYLQKKSYEFSLVSLDKNTVITCTWALFSPPDPHQEDYKYFLSDDEKQNLALIGSVPRNGIEQVRIHWLLDAVTVIKDGSQLSYNFTLLDELIKNLWIHNLRPGFEIMGNPSNHFTNFEDPSQIHEWKSLVQTVAERYIEKYGLDYVSQWNFETWNEPDHGDFDNLKFTIQGFMNYYDACSEGLKAAHTSLKFGGPGGSCKDPPQSPICWTLLQHCSNGANYFTNETGVRIDFISFHHKGEGSSKHILDTELETIKRIRSNYPLLAKVPIFNDEGDPLVGWSRPQWWRADTTYAAVVTKVIVQHQHLLITPNPNYLYSLISNDNGFLNFYPTFFEQRTLNTRFQMNNTKPNSVQLIKKPVLAVMGLLARLGDRLVYVEDLKKTETTDLGILATLEFVNTSWSAAILISNSADTSLFTGFDEISLNVSGIPEVGSYIYVVYLLDREHGNPHRVWLLQGKPIFPTKEQFDEMRTHEEAVRVKGPTAFTQKDLTLTLALKKPGVMLVHMCQKSSAPTGKVHNVTLYQVTPSDLLVTWSDSYIATPCILTFELEHSTQSEGGPYNRVNKNDITFTSFVYSTSAPETIQGWYRVRAVDYWMRGGVYSDVIYYTA